MELITTTPAKQRDRQLLMLTHLSQLLTFFTGVGGFIVPLVLWLTKKDEVEGMDIHGKSIINFQITMFLGMMLSIPLILLFGLGILTLIFFGVLSFVLPVVNGLKADKGEDPSMFCTIEFIS